MKKFTTYMMMIAVVALASSCRKENIQPEATTVTQIVNVDLATNARYTYDIAYHGNANDVVISKQATNYLISKTNVLSADRIQFEYQPAQNYTGTDEIQITQNSAEHHKGQGTCGNGSSHGNKIVYIFKVHVSSTSRISKIICPAF